VDVALQPGAQGELGPALGSGGGDSAEKPAGQLGSQWGVMSEGRVEAEAEAGREGAGLPTVKPPSLARLAVGRLAVAGDLSLS